MWISWTIFTDFSETLAEYKTLVSLVVSKLRIDSSGLVPESSCVLSLFQRILAKISRFSFPSLVVITMCLFNTRNHFTGEIVYYLHRADGALPQYRVSDL